MTLGTYRNAFSLPGRISEVHDGHRGAASEPYTLGDDNEIICRTVHCECGEVFTAFIGEFFDDRLSHAKELKEFSFTVTVGAASVDEAVQVMSERINHDEDYGFDYTIEWDERAVLDLLEAARSLATMPGDPPNTEYDRAILELVANTIPGMASLYADAPELATELVLGRAANKREEEDDE